jgi:hypothetical protein
VAEIEIFDLALKTETLVDDVLRAIDRAIPLPILFPVALSSSAPAWSQPISGPARRKPANGSSTVTSPAITATEWQPADAPRQPLPIALDLHSLYEQLLRSLLPQAARPGESLPEQVERLTRLRSRQNEYKQDGSPPAQGKTVQPQGGAQRQIARTQERNRPTGLTRIFHKFA